MRCLHRAPQTTDPCAYRLELDMDTLLVSKGPGFRLAQLHEWLICPRCRNRRIVITYLPPAEQDSDGVKRPARMQRRPAVPDDPLDQEFRFRVLDHLMRGGLPEVVAAANAHDAAEGAFLGASRSRPGRPISLMDSARELKRQELDLDAMNAAPRKQTL